VIKPSYQEARCVDYVRAFDILDKKSIRSTIDARVGLHLNSVYALIGIDSYSVLTLIH